MTRNPQNLILETELFEDDVCDYKRPGCKFYLACMNEAVVAGWQQFHCLSCEAYEYAAPNSQEMAFVATLFKAARKLGCAPEEPDSADAVDTEEKEGL